MRSMERPGPHPDQKLTSPADWLRQRAKAADTHITDIARRSGVDPAALSREMKKNGPSRTVLQLIGRALGWQVPPEILAQARPGKAAGANRARRGHQTPNPQPRIVPADEMEVWTTYPREGPWFFYNDHEVVETAPRPPALQTAQHIAAIRMPNMTMMPWRQPDEFVVLALRRQVTAGNHALVRLISRARPNDPELCLIARIDRLPDGDQPPLMTIYNAPSAALDMRYFSFASMIRILEWPEVAGLA